MSSILIRSLLAGTMLLPPLALGPDTDSAPGSAGTWSAQNEASGAAGESPAPAQIAEWAAASGDNRGLPFVVVDKTYGQLYVFDSRGELQALRPIASDERVRSRSACRCSRWARCRAASRRASSC